MKVKIKKWYAVAAWKWDVNDELCGICRMPFDGFCVACKSPGDECPPVWGKCSHSFHMHCILKWIEGQNNPTCCMCRRPWEFR